MPEQQWDDDSRPHGTPGEGDGETWDSTLRAWVTTGVMPEPVALGEEEIERIDLLFRGAVERDEPQPLLLANSADMDAMLVSFAYHNKARLQLMATNIRTLMQLRADTIEDCPYTAPLISQFKFNDWVQRAGQLRREIERSQRRQATRTAARNGSPHARERTTAADIQEDLTPAQMIDHTSIYLIAVGHLLDKRRGRIWYDEFYNKVMTDWEGGASTRVVAPAEFDVSHQLALMQWLMSIDGALSRMGERVLEQALARVAYQDRRHCVREWLGSLEPWDGEERLSRLMPEVFSTADNDYTQRVGQNWLVSLVARVLEPGCKVDTMPVLYGAQGEAKTWALKIIASEQWYDVTQEKTDNKDFLMKLQGKWLIEIGEMHSVATSKVEQGQIKSLLTNDVDRFRPPYTKLMKDFKRQMVFSGTTNHDDWHIDTTGGRRYNPVHCLGAIDLAKLREWRCQLFAEALVKYRHEWKWWLVPVEGHRAALEAQQASGPHDNTIAAWLREYQRGGEMHWDEGPASATLGAEVRARRVEPVGPDVRAETTAERYGNLITTERLVIEGIGAPLGDVVKHQNGISATMMRLGWRKAQRRLGGVRIRYWVCDSPEGYGVAAPAQQELDVEV